eukprot:s1115_g3.t1
MNDILLFQPDDTVRAISFDGHFGIHRPLRNLDPSRTVKLKGHPRTKKILREHDRSCTCRTRDCVRLVLPQRTAGWQFAVDPSSRRMLGAIEHCQNENNAEKAKLLSAVMGMDKVEADSLIHDDACHFEQFIKKKKYSEHFDNIRYFVVDELDALVTLISELRGVQLQVDPAALDEVRTFLQGHEAETSKSATHVVLESYPDWWAPPGLVVQGTEDLEDLNRHMGFLHSLGVPLTLAERRTPAFRFFQDLEAWGSREAAPGVNQLMSPDIVGMGVGQ